MVPYYLQIFSLPFSLFRCCVVQQFAVENSSRPFFFLPTQRPSLLPTLQYGNTARRVSFFCLMTGHLAFRWFALFHWFIQPWELGRACKRNQTLKITVTFMRLPVWMNYPLEPLSKSLNQNLLRRVDGGLMPDVETKSLNRGDQNTAGLG